jgi:hypothetical protein
MNTIEVTKEVNNQPILTYTKPLSKTCKKYLDLIKKRKFTKIEIQSFRKALNGCSTISVEEQVLLKNKFYEAVGSKRPINITKEQSDFGIAWLRNKAFKLNGESRKSSPFGMREENVIRNFKKFEFCGLYDINHFGNHSNYTPIFRVIDIDGNEFEYTIYGGYGGVTIEIVG